MTHDVEFPSDWDRMTESQRSAWLAKWFDLNVDLHQRIGKMQRDRAQKALKNSRTLNGKGRHKK